MMVVVATKFVSSSKQFNTVPFRALLTGLIIILDISGRICGSESLEKFTMMEVPIISGAIGRPLTPVIEIGLAM
jgi:hypothetical protein